SIKTIAVTATNRSPVAKATLDHKEENQGQLHQCAFLVFPLFGAAWRGFTIFCLFIRRIGRNAFILQLRNDYSIRGAMRDSSDLGMFVIVIRSLTERFELC